MPIRSQEWRIDRVHRLNNAIVEEAAQFDADFGAVTPDVQAWSKLMHNEIQAHLEYLRGKRDTRPVRRVLQPSEAEIERARVELEATKHEISSEQLAKKKARWRRLWVRSFAAITGFEFQQRDAVGEERAWADRIANEMLAMVARLRHTMERDHPGMPPIDDIETTEIVRALLLDDDDDDDGDDRPDEGRPGTSSAGA
jgi:hypothetical protein